jgi:hypothetical protein
VTIVHKALSGYIYNMKVYADEKKNLENPVLSVPEKM